jgi:hypothetical protein
MIGYDERIIGEERRGGEEGDMRWDAMGKMRRGEERIGG